MAERRDLSPSVLFDVPGPGEGGRQQPEGGHRQTQVSDCGISRGTEESTGEDEGEHQDQQDVHREFQKSS